MTSSDRQFTWRQGDVLPDDTAVSLGIYPAEESGASFAIVVSHDCDLTATIDKEPIAEIILAKRIETMGADSFGKTARRLHIEYQTATSPLILEISATTKTAVNKTNLFASTPCKDINLDGRGIGILQRWLAARYHRAAFPEAFEDRLRTATLPGKRPLPKKMESILTDGGAHIRALLFDLDEGKDIERASPDDLYHLGIVVLYDSLQDEPTAASAATKAAEELEALFEQAFHATPSDWKNICLDYCDPMSDSAMTVAQREVFKQWRLEHMSLQDDPPQAMLTPN